MEFDPIKDVLASNLAAIQEALILGIRAPVRDSVHGLIDYQYFAQVQEREKYWGGTARENEKGNSQQGREHFDAMQNTWPQWWLLLRRSTAPDLADYASPRHAQRFRNYCGTVGLVNVDEFGRNVKCCREEWGKAFRALSRRSHDGDNTNGDLHKHTGTETRLGRSPPRQKYLGQGESTGCVGFLAFGSESAKWRCQSLVQGIGSRARAAATTARYVITQQRRFYDDDQAKVMVVGMGSDTC
ncbi:hypothetical protein C8J57DRAFT_1213361 [Mycena rebaudengoi]|nr:hypothetical protein C8J57DRAFT_1213361 [Mycena rebaudengoi]